MKRARRVEEWIKTLSEEQKDSILLELTEFSIDAEYVAFPESFKAPYYDSTGEYLDGIEREE